MSYIPTGAEDPQLVDIAQRRLELDREKLKMAKRSALFDGISMIATVAIPVAAFLGLKELFGWNKKKPNPYGSIAHANKEQLARLYRSKPSSRSAIAREWKRRGYTGAP